MRLFRLLPLFILFVAAPALAEGPHRLALQITDNDADKMNTVLNVAANVSKYFSDKGEEVEIQVVAFNAGLHMLREDTSPVKPRFASFAKGMQNVSFKACQNTIDGMTKRDSAIIQEAFIPGATMVLMRDGTPAQMTADAFAERIGHPAHPSTAKIEERIHSPLIRIDNDLAVVWAPFDFLIDGKVDHCGTDLFNLVRANGKWLISKRYISSDSGL